MPVLVLVGLTKATGIDLDTDGASRIDFLTPGVLALAVMTTSFTSQAIASSFDRRNGVLRLLSTTPLGRGGLLAGKVLGVLVVEVVQVVVIGADRAAARLAPGPRRACCSPLVAIVLGTAAFTSLALLVAGTLRAEAVLAVANLLLLVLAVAGGVIVPAEPAARARWRTSRCCCRPARSARRCARRSWHGVAARRGRSWCSSAGPPRSAGARAACSAGTDRCRGPSRVTSLAAAARRGRRRAGP